MTFREFVEAICYANSTKFSIQAAEELLREIKKDKGFDKLLEKDFHSKMPSYLRKDRNISEKLAAEIRGYKTKDLRQYISDQCQKKGGKQRLCDALQKYRPEVNEQTAIKCAVELFEEMLNSVITGRKNKPSTDRISSVSKKDEQDVYQTLPEPVVTDSSTSSSDELYHLLQKLEKRAIKLFTDYLKSSAEYDTATQDERKEYDETICKEHEAFTTLNDMLSSLVVDYPDFSQLKDLFYSGDGWMLSFFRPWNDPNALKMPDGMLDSYLKRLNETKEALPIYFDQFSS